MVTMYIYRVSYFFAKTKGLHFYEKQGYRYYCPPTAVVEKTAVGYTAYGGAVVAV